MRGILNTIDGSMITGENDGLFIKLWESFKCFNETLEKSKELTYYGKEISKDNPARSWYNPELSLDKFLSSLRHTALSVLDSNNSYRVVGFKEIRYSGDSINPKELGVYLNFLQHTLFEGAYIVFLTRDKEQVAQSQRVNFNIVDIEYIDEFFKCITSLSGDRRFFIDYSQLNKDSDKLVELFELLDEKYNKKLVDEALGLRYSYSRRTE
jgi:hypothetical protein